MLEVHFEELGIGGVCAASVMVGGVWTGRVARGLAAPGVIIPTQAPRRGRRIQTSPDSPPILLSLEYLAPPSHVVQQ